MKSSLTASRTTLNNEQMQTNAIMMCESRELLKMQQEDEQPVTVNIKKMGQGNFDTNPTSIDRVHRSNNSHEASSFEIQHLQRTLQAERERFSKEIERLKRHKAEDQKRYDDDLMRKTAALEKQKANYNREIERVNKMNQDLINEVQSITIVCERSRQEKEDQMEKNCALDTHVRDLEGDIQRLSSDNERLKAENHEFNDQSRHIMGDNQHLIRDIEPSARPNTQAVPQSGMSRRWLMMLCFMCVFFWGLFSGVGVIVSLIHLGLAFRCSLDYEGG